MNSRTWNDILIARIGWLLLSISLMMLLQPPKSLKVLLYSMACASVGFVSCKVGEAVARRWSSRRESSI